MKKVSDEITTRDIEVKQISEEINEKIIKKIHRTFGRKIWLCVAGGGRWVNGSLSWRGDDVRLYPVKIIILWFSDIGKI